MTVDDAGFCKTCPYFNFTPQVGGWPFRPSTCHRFPPDNGVLPWPIVGPEDWCGEHPARQRKVRNTLLGE